VFGQPVTFTATVAAKSPGAGTPTGTVTFKDGSSTLGTGTLNSSARRCSRPARSRSAALDHRVLRRRRDLQRKHFEPAHPDGEEGPRPHHHVGQLLGQPSVSGQSVTFTATVTAKGSIGSPERHGDLRGRPDHSRQRHAEQLGPGDVHDQHLTVGSHSITASYGGDTTFKEGTSPKFTQTVNP